LANHNFAPFRLKLDDDGEQEQEQSVKPAIASKRLENERRPLNSKCQHRLGFGQNPTVGTWTLNVMRGAELSRLLGRAMRVAFRIELNTWDHEYLNPETLQE